MSQVYEEMARGDELLRACQLHCLGVTESQWQMPVADFIDGRNPTPNMRKPDDLKNAMLALYQRLVTEHDDGGRRFVLTMCDMLESYVSEGHRSNLLAKDAVSGLHQVKPLYIFTHN